MNQYQFKILDPKRIHGHPEEIELSNQLYQTWTEVFTKVVVEAGGKLDPDDYFRNDFALVIYDRSEILGFSLCTEFDLRLLSSQNHHYWKTMKPSTVETLQTKGVHRLMSMEYLTVLPKWRQVSRRQISWAEVLVGLGLLYQDEFPVHAMVGTPRADIRMSAMCESMGGVAAQEPIMKMNYPCSVHVFTKGEAGERRFPNPLTQDWAHQLWNQRTDFRNTEINITETYKQAA